MQTQIESLMTTAGAARDRLNLALLSGAVDVQPASKRLRHLQTVAVALSLSLAAGKAAFAQDVIGLQPVSQAVISGIEVIAVAAICWGFMRLMSGRHTVEGLVTMAVGGLGIAKVQAVASLFGLAGG